MDVTEAWNIIRVKIIGNNDQDFVNDFKMQCTDEERIIFILNVMLKYNIIPSMYHDTKNAKESEKLRECGNKIFLSMPLTSTSCMETLRLYTESIAYAPYPSEQLALAYANRSAVLIKLHKYEECICDIDRALALTYPDKLRAKIYVRQIDCFEALNHPRMEFAIDEAQQWLNKMSLDNVNCKNLDDKLASIKKMPKTCNTNKQSNKKHRIKPPLPTIKTCNAKFPCASDALTMKYNEQYGRHIVATKKIEPNEILVVEKPYSLLLNPENMYTHCSNCLEVCWANIPCDYCTCSMYCSEECKITSWQKYHDIECSVFPSMLKMNYSTSQLFSLRIAIQAVRESSSIQALKEELKEVDGCNDPFMKGFSKNGVLMGNKYRCLLAFDTHAKDTEDRLFIRSLNASFILYTLATCTNMFGNPLKKDIAELLKINDVTFVGGLILRNQRLIPCNRHGFTELQLCRMLPFSRGSAMMPFLTLFNHSCDPNVARHSRSGHMIMSALYPIEKGEQIFDSYSQLYSYIPKAIRQKDLLKKYFFKCNCLPCQENWPLFNDLKSVINFGIKKDVFYDVVKLLKKCNTYKENAKKGIIFDKSDIVDDAIRMIKLFYYQTPKPCLELTQLIEELKSIVYLTGNKFEIPRL
ncbi:SET and MYND domain-containing protein 4-like [Colletes gigas]|uniref:SET and MYND domain-containing protein 4-like n=1 Tax=Colletes gigas TaxID=935657 RepID=UPI001C9AEE4F|nr:SET and MYND domain-containing protein 4-like [Colletes gigas]